nr:hypothetical protein [Xanthomonas oryzae]
MLLLQLFHARATGLGILIRQHRRIALQQRIDLLDVLHRVEFQRPLFLVTRHRPDHVVPVAVELVHHAHRVPQAQQHRHVGLSLIALFAVVAGRTHARIALLQRLLGRSAAHAMGAQRPGVARAVGVQYIGLVAAAGRADRRRLAIVRQLRRLADLAGKAAILQRHLQILGAGQRHRIALGLRRADPLLGRDRLHALADRR